MERDPHRTLPTSVALLGRVTWLIQAPLVPPALHAHVGHDHGASPDLSSAVPAKPRAEAHGNAVELVVILEHDQLALYLDDFATNAPIGHAEVRVESTTPAGRREDVALIGEDTVYRLDAPWLSAPGRHDLVISVQDDRRFDLLTATLEVSPPDAALAQTSPPTPSTAIPWSDVGVWALVFALGLLVGVWVRRGLRPRRGTGDALVEPSRREVVDAP